MSNEKSKVGKLKPETKEKLELSLEMCAKDAIDLVTEAYGKDIFDKAGRGDKVWLYNGASKALTCMEKLKRILMDDELTSGSTAGRTESAESQAAKLLEGIAKKLDERNKQRPS